MKVLLCTTSGKWVSPNDFIDYNPKVIGNRSPSHLTYVDICKLSLKRNICLLTLDVRSSLAYALCPIAYACKMQTPTLRWSFDPLFPNPLLHFTYKLSVQFHSGQTQCWLATASVGTTRLPLPASIPNWWAVPTEVSWYLLAVRGRFTALKYWHWQGCVSVVMHSQSSNHWSTNPWPRWHKPNAIIRGWQKTARSDLNEGTLVQSY